MKGLMKSFLGSSSGSSSSPAAAALKSLSVQPVPSFYTMASNRWHLDTRPVKKIIAFPDLLSSSFQWQTLLRPITDLPARGLMASDPLEVFCVELRGHGRSPGIALGADDNYTVANAADALLLKATSLNCDKAILVGTGLGAQIACQAAILSPASFESVCVFVSSMEELNAYNPKSSRFREALLAVAAKPCAEDDLETTLGSAAGQPWSATDLFLLRSMLQKRDDGMMVPSVDTALLASDASLSPAYGSGTYDGRVVVHVKTTEAVPVESQQLFKKNFPNAKVLAMNTNGHSLTSPEVPVALLLLHSLGMLMKKPDLESA